jgi:hypothetical protein
MKNGKNVLAKIGVWLIIVALVLLIVYWLIESRKTKKPEVMITCTHNNTEEPIQFYENRGIKRVLLYGPEYVQIMNINGEMLLIPVTELKNYTCDG